MENKEVTVCTFLGIDFLAFNAIENYRFIKQFQWVKGREGEKQNKQMKKQDQEK